ncbi:MAG: shikimate dehydrogenase, partial [Candidatus Bathyarchaeia archaeon]
MHNAAFQHMGLKFHYMSFEIAPENLVTVLKGLRWIAHGLNVTIPFKTAVLGLVDELSEEAEKTGAVNTIVMQNGRMKGYNTDVVGVLQPFRRRGISLLGAQALVIGAGGASRACIVALNRLGCSDFMVLNRSRGRFEELKAYLETRLGVDLSWYPLDMEFLSSFARMSDVI